MTKEGFCTDCGWEGEGPHDHEKRLASPPAQGVRKCEILLDVSVGGQRPKADYTAELLRAANDLGLDSKKIARVERVQADLALARKVIFLLYWTQELPRSQILVLPKLPEKLETAVRRLDRLCPKCDDFNEGCQDEEHDRFLEEEAVLHLVGTLSSHLEAARDELRGLRLKLGPTEKP
jgi:hypothetical protein